jgi:hypothetical protein
MHRYNFPVPIVDYLSIPPAIGAALKANAPLDGVAGLLCYAFA